MKKKQLLITLSQDIESWLTTEINKTGESPSVIIRQAIRQAMAWKKDIVEEPKRGPGRPPKEKESEPVWTLDNLPPTEKEVGLWMIEQLKQLKAEGKVTSFKQVIAISEEVKSIFMALRKRNDHFRNTHGIQDGLAWLKKKGLIAESGKMDGEYDPIYDVME